MASPADPGSVDHSSADAGAQPAGDPGAAAGTRRAFVHIGAPKTGTTFIQNVLWANREHLAQAGFGYPYERPGEHFGAMLDLRQMTWGGYPDREHWAGRWDAVAQRARAWPGATVLLTNEILGGARTAQIQRLVRSLSPAEVHVVFTARDFARQLLSDWQEHVKHKHTVTLERFVDDLVRLGADAPAPFGEMFWGLHDAGAVLPRWADVVGDRRVTLITVPQPGAPRSLLWERFCAVVGLDPGLCSLDVERVNESLGLTEAELLRRVNSELQKIPPEHYDALVRRQLVRTLAGRSRRAVLPPEHLAWVEQRSHALIDQVRAHDYRVVGDLDELLPVPEDHAGYRPSHTLPEPDLLSSAVLATGAALRAAARQREEARTVKQRFGLLPDAPLPPPRGRRRLRDVLRGPLRRVVSRLAGSA